MIRTLAIAGIVGCLLTAAWVAVAYASLTGEVGAL